MFGAVVAGDRVGPPPNKDMTSSAADDGAAVAGLAGAALTPSNPSNKESPVATGCAPCAIVCIGAGEESDIKSPNKSPPLDV